MVFVEGPSVADGYWQDEDATERVFVDGGVYSETLNLVSGTNIVGGFNAGLGALHASLCRRNARRSGCRTGFGAKARLAQDLPVLRQ